MTYYEIRAALVECQDLPGRILACARESLDRGATVPELTKPPGRNMRQEKTFARLPRAFFACALQQSKMYYYHMSCLNGTAMRYTNAPRMPRPIETIERYYFIEHRRRSRNKQLASSFIKQPRPRPAARRLPQDRTLYSRRAAVSSLVEQGVRAPLTTNGLGPSTTASWFGLGLVTVSYRIGIPSEKVLYWDQTDFFFSASTS